MIGMLGIKGILYSLAAVGVASCLTYLVHTIKAAGASEVALEVSQQELEAQHAAVAAHNAAVVRLTKVNADLQAKAKTRQTALQAALAAIPQSKATDTCPANCLLPSL